MPVTKTELMLRGISSYNKSKEILPLNHLHRAMIVALGQEAVAEVQNIMKKKITASK
jgi:hypothetical protein